MLVVCPFWQKDQHLLIANLQWALSLDKQTEFECLLVHPSDMEAIEVEELADKLFAKTTTHLIDPCPFQGWPQGKNWAFQHACRYIYDRYKEPFLWLEPDATPLKKGWLQDIAQDHAASGKLFSGAFCGGGTFLDAVGVYPANMLSVSRDAILCRAAPFDQVAGRDVAQYASGSSRFAFLSDVNGKPPTFRTKEDVALLVKKDAAVFHRCKDASLIQVLSQGAIKSFFSSIGAVGSKPNPHAKKDQTAIVMLGRYGDIVNILPVAKHINDSQAKPAIMVSEAFSDVLGGITYADTEIYPGDFTDLQNAVTKAESIYSKVLVAQVNTRNVGVNTQCGSFSQESWRQLGYLDKWTRLPLIFDNRNLKREERLWASIKRQKDKKTILVNLNGKSSPYRDHLQMYQDILARWEQRFEIIDLATVKAQRIYDLVGIMDRADILITIDTATTHLAYASAIPVVNLVAQEPTLWHGSMPRGHSLLALRYNEAWVRKEDLHDAIGMVAHHPTKSAAPIHKKVRETWHETNKTAPSVLEQTNWPCGHFDLECTKEHVNFNPSLTNQNGVLWFVSRRWVKGQQDGLWFSDPVVRILNPDMTLGHGRQLDYGGHKLDQREDARLYFEDGRFWTSFGYYRHHMSWCVCQRMDSFDQEWKHISSLQVPYGGNVSSNEVGARWQKNWLWLKHLGSWYFIYSFNPHVVIRLDGADSLIKYETKIDNLDWQFGEIRGGTPPVRIGDEFLSFFHSSIPWRGNLKRYYAGAYCFSAKEPFKVTRMTPKPILVGSAQDNRVVNGPLVTFPSGAVLLDKEWLMVAGTNDQLCTWFRIPHAELEELMEAV